MFWWNGVIVSICNINNYYCFLWCAIFYIVVYLHKFCNGSTGCYCYLSFFTCIIGKERNLTWNECFSILSSFSMIIFGFLSAVAGSHGLTTINKFRINDYSCCILLYESEVFLINRENYSSTTLLQEKMLMISKIKTKYPQIVLCCFEAIFFVIYWLQFLSHEYTVYGYMLVTAYMIVLY